MKTTLDLNESLIVRCEELARDEGCSLEALIEEGLRHVLARRRVAGSETRKPKSLPVCSQGGGVLSGVNLNDSSELLDQMGDS